MCHAHGHKCQHSEASEARTCGLSVSCQALYHWATVLPAHLVKCPTYDQGVIDSNPTINAMLCPWARHLILIAKYWFNLWNYWFKPGKGYAMTEKNVIWDVKH